MEGKHVVFARVTHDLGWSTMASGVATMRSAGKGDNSGAVKGVAEDKPAARRPSSNSTVWWLVLVPIVIAAITAAVPSSVQPDFIKNFKWVHGSTVGSSVKWPATGAIGYLIILKALQVCRRCRAAARVRQS